MDRFILLAGIFSIAFAAEKLTIGSCYTGTLEVNERDRLFYLSVPENYAYVEITLTATTPGSVCDYLYIFSSWVGFPCGNTPNSDGLNKNGDPCYNKDQICMFCLKI